MSNTRGYVGTAHDVTAELRHASTCSLPPRMYTAVHVYSCRALHESDGSWRIAGLLFSTGTSALHAGTDPRVTPRVSM